MRYKVNAGDDLTLYQSVLNLLAVSHARVCLRNDKRRTVAIEDASEDLRERLLRLGASVGIDAQYSPEN